MVYIRKAYGDEKVFGTTEIKSKSIVEPGQCLPMNKLIKGVINGSIVINPHFMEYDYKETLSDEFEAHGTPAEIAKQQNDAFISALDSQSNVPSDPTASPSFDAVDAENLAISLAAEQAALKGAAVAAGGSSEAPQTASAATSAGNAADSLSSGGAAAN